MACGLFLYEFLAGIDFLSSMNYCLFVSIIFKEQNELNKDLRKRKVIQFPRRLLFDLIVIEAKSFM